MKVLILALFLLTSCTYDEWDWTPDVYGWVSDEGALVNVKGEKVTIGSPRFSHMYCFPPENIAELKANILKVDGSKGGHFEEEIEKIFLTLGLPEEINYEGCPWNQADCM